MPGREIRFQRTVASYEQKNYEEVLLNKFKTKIRKNSRKDGQHPRILKDKADSIKKNTAERIFNSSLAPRKVSAKDQKEGIVILVLKKTPEG